MQCVEHFQHQACQVWQHYTGRHKQLFVVNKYWDKLKSPHFHVWLTRKWTSTSYLNVMQTNSAQIKETSPWRVWSPNYLVVDMQCKLNLSDQQFDKLSKGKPVYQPPCACSHRYWLQYHTHWLQYHTDTVYSTKQTLFTVPAVLHIYKGANTLAVSLNSLPLISSSKSREKTSVPG